MSGWHKRPAHQPIRGFSGSPAVVTIHTDRMRGESPKGDSVKSPAKKSVPASQKPTPDVLVANTGTVFTFCPLTAHSGEWNERTNAIGIISKTGRYGGTYANSDIAFEFGTWICPEFKLYLIKEFQRLKEQEQKLLNPEWDYRRFLSKVNYRLHTDAIKDNIIPKYQNLTKDQEGYISLKKQRY